MISDKSIQVILEAKAGIRLSLYTGELQCGFPEWMSTMHFYKASKGSRLTLVSKEYSYAVATYSLHRDLTYIYTYSYQKEENWTTYQQDLTPESYGQQDYVFTEDLYFRVNLKRMDEHAISEEEAEQVNKILNYFVPVALHHEKPYFNDEIKLTIESMNAKRTEKSMTFALLTDTHYTVNGTWEDTSDNIQTLHNAVVLDGIIHLGDFTDGMVSARIMKDYVRRQVNDLKGNGIPLYYVLGNHDSNYFNGNPEIMEKQEQRDFYFCFIDPDIIRNPDSSYYYVDYDQISLRGIFLDSYDHNVKERYGFGAEELDWLEEILRKTPEGYSVVIFSHVPPLPELHYWTDTIRNSDRLMNILNSYDALEGKCILAFIHGHNHADQVYNKGRFPIISIGCAKCEYFTDKKPEGSQTFSRTLNSVTQELWDVMIITPEERIIDFVRFGAGEDRKVVRAARGQERGTI